MPLISGICQRFRKTCQASENQGKIMQCELGIIVTQQQGRDNNNGTLGQESRLFPHDKGMKASACDLDQAKWVAPWGKPLGPKPPLQGSHVQQVKRYHAGRCCHQTQQSLQMFHSE